MTSKITKLLLFPNNCTPDVSPEIHPKAHKISRTMRLCGKDDTTVRICEQKLNDSDARPL